MFKLPRTPRQLVTCWSKYTFWSVFRIYSFIEEEILIPESIIHYDNNWNRRQHHQDNQHQNNNDNKTIKITDEIQSTFNQAKHNTKIKWFVIGRKSPRTLLVAKKFARTNLPDDQLNSILPVLNLLTMMAGIRSINYENVSHYLKRKLTNQISIYFWRKILDLNSGDPDYQSSQMRFFQGYLGN